MPAVVGPFVGFALGVMLAWICRADAPREEARILRDHAMVAALFGAMVFAPVCAYFLIFWGDWSYVYLVDKSRVPSALELVLVLADAALVVLGFLAGQAAAKRRAERVLVALGAVPACAALTIVLVLFSRLRVEGTFHQVEAHFGTQKVAGRPLGYAIAWMNAMVAAGVVLAARVLLGGTHAVPPPVDATVSAPGAPGAVEPRSPRLGRAGR